MVARASLDFSEISMRSKPIVAGHSNIVFVHQYRTDHEIALCTADSSQLDVARLSNKGRDDISR